MVSVRQEDGAIVFEVTVLPRSSRNRIIGPAGGALRIALTAPPVDGEANEALRKLLAKKLSVAKSAVEIVRGERGRKKLVRVYGADPSAFDGDSS